MLQSNTILVFAPHNDDEVIGVGGSIAKLAKTNDIFVCEVTTSKSEESLKRMRPEAAKAHKLLGVKNTFFLDLPVIGIRQCDMREVNKRFESIVANLKPNIVFLPHEGDMHTDHQDTVNAAMVALRPLNNPQLNAIFAYETLSETDWNTPNIKNAFIPNFWIDISDTIEIKKEAMNCYQSQLRQYPHPRSIRAISALAEHRGSIIGVEYAESFMLLRGKI